MDPVETAMHDSIRAARRGHLVTVDEALDCILALPLRCSGLPGATKSVHVTEIVTREGEHMEASYLRGSRHVVKRLAS